MSGPNFELITELQTLTRRDFPLADPTFLAGVGSNPLIDGEWLELDANYKLIRGVPAEGTSLLVFPVHTERGRYDTQAIGKTNVLYLGQYEAESTVVTGPFTLGDALTVNAGAGALLNKRVLKTQTAANGVAIVGYVSKVISATKVRFVHFGNVLA